MITAFTARRRAEEFSSLVDSTSGPTDARYVDLLEVVGAMRSAAPVEARPAFVADLRERLMAAADEALAPAADAELRARLTVTPRRTPRERRIAVAIGGFAIVGATTSLAMAAQTALPGDTLYPLKRAIENARASVQADEGDRGSTLLHNAAGRLDEIDELTQGSGGDAEAIAATLQAFADQASAASALLITAYESTGEESTIAELRDFAADSLAALEALEGLVPDEARGALIQAVQVLGQIDEQALYACPTCSDVARLPISSLDAVQQVAQAIVGETPDDPTGQTDQGRPGGKGGNGGTGGGVTAPSTGATDGGPVASPSPGTPGQPAPAPSTPANPIDELTDGIENGGKPPSGTPTTPGELLEELEDVTGDLTGPLFP
jgi:hypothetical protein